MPHQAPGALHTPGRELKRGCVSFSPGFFIFPWVFKQPHAKAQAPPSVN